MGCGTQAANKAIKTILMWKSILMEKSGDAEKGLEVSLKKKKQEKSVPIFSGCLETLSDFYGPAVIISRWRH